MSNTLKAICLLLSLSVTAAVESRPQQKSQDELSPGDIVLEYFDPHGVRWEPVVDFEQATLRVAGPKGIAWEQQFQAGEALDYQLLDLEGVPLPDGSYTYEWRITIFLPDAEEPRVLKIQSGDFEIQEGFAQSLVKPVAEEVFPMTTNAGGNHFVGNLTTDSDLCVGCSDGDDADVDFIPAGIRSKGPYPSIVLDEDSPDENWMLSTNSGNFSITELPTGDETGLLAPFLIKDRAASGAFTIDTAGAIGMGTQVPSAALHVVRSDGTAQVLVEDIAVTAAVRTMFQLTNNGAPRFAVRNAASGVEWSFQQSGPGNFLISKEGTGGPELQVYGTGMVRMGPGGANNFTLSPVGNLTIAGSLTANGSTFPDYVFEPDYSLMPLSDLRTYIEEEKRLPNIPSAEDVENQGGHNMTELQLKLLEKIEELTLYILGQEKKLERVEALERENAQMEARLAAIEGMLSDRRNQGELGSGTKLSCK